MMRLRGSSLFDAPSGAIFQTASAAHRLLQQGKPGGNVVVFGIVIGIIIALGIVVMAGVLIYVYTCKPANVSRHNSTVTEEKATTCRDLGHVLAPTTAARLATELDAEAGRKYTQIWVCDFCNKNFRTIDEQTLYHCTHRGCGVDLCRTCYGELHRQQSGFAASDLDPVVAVPVSESGRKDHNGSSGSLRGKRKHSDGKVHPGGAYAVSGSECEGGRQSDRDGRKGSGYGADFPTNGDGTLEKKRKNSGSSVHSTGSQHGVSDYNPNYAAIYLAGSDRERHTEHNKHFPKRRGSRDSQHSSDAGDGYRRKGSGAEADFPSTYGSSHDGTVERKRRGSRDSQHLSDAEGGYRRKGSGAEADFPTTYGSSHDGTVERKRRGSRDSQPSDEAANIFGRRGSKDSIRSHASDEGKNKHASNASSHASAAHAASYAAVYGEDW